MVETADTSPGNGRHSGRMCDPQDFPGTDSQTLMLG
jgi:hypothetical protein